MNEKNKKVKVSEEALWDTENYLCNYKFCRKLLAMRNYEKKYFDTMEWESESPAEFTVARAKMFEIRHFVLDMENSSEKLLLYYHYIRGESIERCGELLGISRSSAFRMKRRALEQAFLHSVKLGKNLAKERF